MADEFRRRRANAASPDNRFVAAYYKETPGATNQIAVLPLDGQPAGQFRKIDFYSGAGTGVPLRWSANGKGLVCVVNKNGADNLWLVPFEGGAAATDKFRFG